jgi:hypothetical protein
MITLNKIYFNLNYIQFVFVCLLVVCLFISFYIMVITLFSKDKTHNHVFSAWQFPMLLAILIDTIHRK